MNGEEVKALFAHYVAPSYGRFDLVLDHGRGSELWDVAGKRYLDLGTGIAVCSLGHAHPEISAALTEQSRRLLHVSNLYYTELQGRLAEQLVQRIASGRCFFCNSGTEANEGLYKLARKFGEPNERFEIITTLNSFHGRSLAGIAATGQEKVKIGFAPAVPGFVHVPFNDLEAARGALTPQTAAILIEPIQGESGVKLATPEYLLGLRRLCDEHDLLLLFDEVQAGHFRTGAFQSWQCLLENVEGAEGFQPDAVSMAKSLGGGFPIGAFWVRESLAEIFSAGTHGSTFGGNPLGCAVALKIIEVIERDGLAAIARERGAFLLGQLRALQAEFPEVIAEVRGLGLMIGLEFRPDAPGFRRDQQASSFQATKWLQAHGLLVVPAGTAVIRLLPALNLTQDEATEALQIVTELVRAFAQ